MAPFAASASTLRMPDVNATRERALGHAHEVVVVGRTYWADVGESGEVEARLTEVEDRICTFCGRADVGHERAATVVVAVARIGAATVLGACVGVFLVGDEVVKGSCAPEPVEDQRAGPQTREPRSQWGCRVTVAIRTLIATLAQTDSASMIAEKPRSTAVLGTTAIATPRSRTGTTSPA